MAELKTARPRPRMERCPHEPHRRTRLAAARGRRPLVGRPRLRSRALAAGPAPRRDAPRQPAATSRRSSTSSSSTSRTRATTRPGVRRRPRRICRRRCARKGVLLNAVLRHRAQQPAELRRADQRAGAQPADPGRLPDVLTLGLPAVHDLHHRNGTAGAIGHRIDGGAASRLRSAGDAFRGVVRGAFSEDHDNIRPEPCTSALFFAAALHRGAARLRPFWTSWHSARCSRSRPSSGWPPKGSTPRLPRLAERAQRCRAGDPGPGSHGLRTHRRSLSQPFHDASGASCGSPDDAGVILELARHHEECAESGLLDDGRAKTELTDALACYERVAAMRPGDRVVAEAAARLLLRLGRPEEAMLRLQPLATESDASPAALTGYLACLFRHGHFARLRQACHLSGRHIDLRPFRTTPGKHCGYGQKLR